MSSSLIKTMLSIKGGSGKYSTSNITEGCNDDDLVKFAEAYNSLQVKEADKFIKKVEYLITN